MRKSKFWQLLTLGLVAGVCAVADPASAQESRLQDRVPEPVRGEIDSVLDSARALGIPTEPLVDRALEGASKGASGELILRAVQRLAGELLAARDALGSESTSPEIVAGASALRAGAEPEDLQSLRSLRADQPLTIAAAVLADLVAVGVPADTAAAAVKALAMGADDVEYIQRMLRRHFQHTRSKKADDVLRKWEKVAPKFVKVFPQEYKQALADLAREAEQQDG